jgi:flavin prenyltransferase
LARPKRLVIGISGASGVIYGIRLLEVLKKSDIETHLVMSPAAKVTIVAETRYSPDKVEKLASRVYKFGDIAAAISSGSFQTDGMAIVPCSMHTLGALASGVADNLLTRAAEVTMKEHRKLVIVPRETPLSLIHIENMAKVARAGAIVAPAMPAFYQKPVKLEDIIDHIVGRVLDLFEIEESLFKRWTGISTRA